MLYLFLYDDRAPCQPKLTLNRYGQKLNVFSYYQHRAPKPISLIIVGMKAADRPWARYVFRIR
jgi:hypothetical protein